MVVKSLVQIQVPPVDIWTFYFETQNRDYPDDHVLFFESETGRTYTFAQIKHLSLEWGQGLKHRFNWQKGDVLAFFCPNSIDVPVVNFGVHWAGGVPSPANPTYTPDELARQLLDSGAKALVTTKAFLPAACEAAAKAGLSDDRIMLLGAERDETGKYLHWTDVTAKKAWFQPRKTPIDPKKDLAYLVYSSGTTGLPKGVMLSHYNMVAQALQSDKIDIRSLTWERDAQIGVLPFFHIYGLGVVVNVTLRSGAKCVTMAKFDLERFCHIIQSHQITFCYIPPPIVLALGKAPVVSKYDLGSLRWLNSAAAPLGKELVDAVWERHQIGVKQGYGLSETSPTATKQLAEEWRRYQGSVGKLIASMEAKIVDPETGKEVPEGEAGELLLRGPNIFQGYWKRPELNKECFTDDGFYRTGDMFRVDKRGNFYVTDRLKELIKYKGYQVAPAELEGKIVARDDVADVCVIGVYNDAEATEVPMACVVVAPGVTPSDELAKEMVEWLNKQVGPTKRLRGGVRFVPEVPKSASGKILRRVLRQQVLEESKQPKAKL